MAQVNVHFRTRYPPDPPDPPPTPLCEQRGKRLFNASESLSAGSISRRTGACKERLRTFGVSLLVGSLNVGCKCWCIVVGTHVGTSSWCVRTTRISRSFRPVCRSFLDIWNPVSGQCSFLVLGVGWWWPERRRDSGRIPRPERRRDSGPPSCVSGAFHLDSTGVSPITQKVKTDCRLFSV